jgi:hypothetical protein
MAAYLDSALLPNTRFRFDRAKASEMSAIDGKPVSAYVLR